MNTKAFEKYESEVRSYCRNFPTVFNYAKGSIIKNEEGKEFIDFFSGAGALNYGHNNDYIKEKIIEYFNSDGIIHSLDMYTTAKREFIDYFQQEVLKPRGLSYKIQFTGPTGTNAVEAALKLARKVKKRENVIALMGAFHGMSLGSLALTTDSSSRQGGGVSLNNVTHIPAPYMFPELDTLKYLDTILSDDHSGIDLPAAIVIETVQADGGIYAFDIEWLKGIRKICDKHDILLIVDDIQVGCARTGNFFSFERAGITPDMVLMSKSIGGYGMPFALVLISPEIDIWEPGEHTGTFRGNQISYVAAKAGLEFMLNEHLEEEVKRKEEIVSNFIEKEISPINSNIIARGIGLLWGIDFDKFEDKDLSKKVLSESFNNGLIIERVGRQNTVLKIMPPLVIEDELLIKGLYILRDAIKKLI